MFTDVNMTQYGKSRILSRYVLHFSHSAIVDNEFIVIYAPNCDLWPVVMAREIHFQRDCGIAG
jgi:hypothetical protein